MFSLEVHPPDISLWIHKYFRIWKCLNYKTLLDLSILDKGYLPFKLTRYILMHIMQMKKPKFSKVNFPRSHSAAEIPVRGIQPPPFLSLYWGVHPSLTSRVPHSPNLELIVAPASPALLGEPRPVADFSMTSRVAGKEKEPLLIPCLINHGVGI